MTWLNFSMWLGIIYAIYYLLNILYDNMGKPKVSEKDDNVLSFSEDVKTAVVKLNESTDVKQELKKMEVVDEVLIEKEEAVKDEKVIIAPVESSGGISISELFKLAQTNAIEFTKTVPY